MLSGQTLLTKVLHFLQPASLSGVHVVWMAVVPEKVYKKYKLDKSESVMNVHLPQSCQLISKKFSHFTKNSAVGPKKADVVS